MASNLLVSIFPFFPPLYLYFLSIFPFFVCYVLPFPFLTSFYCTVPFFLLFHYFLSHPFPLFLSFSFFPVAFLIFFLFLYFLMFHILYFPPISACPTLSFVSFPILFSHTVPLMSLLFLWLFLCLFSSPLLSFAFLSFHFISSPCLSLCLHSCPSFPSYFFFLMSFPFRSFSVPFLLLSCPSLCFYGGHALG